MEIVFTKVSDRRHVVSIVRADATTESVELDSRSFLQHDLAHFAVERELGLAGGVWGSVARGGSLGGDGLDGEDMELVESISGPMQTMLRIAASPEQIHEVVQRVAPAYASLELAHRLHTRLRSLAGHWAATPYGGHLRLDWPEDMPT